MKLSARLLALPALGVALATARWLQQGSYNLYSDLGKRLYVPDPDLGWRMLEDGPIWLGVDAILLTGSALGMVGVAWWLFRKKAQVPAALPWLMVAIGLASWVPGIAAFASGGGPEGAVDQPPQGVIEAPDEVAGGLVGLEATQWSLASGVQPGVVATVVAGGESFEARFEQVTGGTLVGDPSDLRQPLRVEVSVDPASVDTGIDGRSKSARVYLQVEEHLSMTFRLTQLIGARNTAPDAAEFSARGELDFIGDTLDIEVLGKIQALDAAARQRLGLDAEAAFRVEANFEVPLQATKLREDAGDFGADSFPIRVGLIFVPMR